MPDITGTGSLSALVTTAQNITIAIHDLSQQLRTIFPQVSALSTTAPSAGTVVFNSSLAEAFLAVTTSSGAVYRVALYPSS